MSLSKMLQQFMREAKVVDKSTLQEREIGNFGYRIRGRWYKFNLCWYSF